MRKEFLNKNKTDIEISEKRHQELVRKLSEHKYGGHKKDIGEKDDREK